MQRITALWLLLAGAAYGAPGGWKAGVARIDITPEKPIYLTGYASRNHPSEGVMQRIWAKALALEDGRKHRVVVVTTDLIGLPGGLANVVYARVQEKYKLDRSALVLNSSHTHTGPVVGDNLNIMFDLDAGQRQTVQDYAVRLIGALVDVVGAALGDLQPAEVSYSVGEAGFAMNRRLKTERGVVIGVNPGGPTDHSVPVLRVDSGGKLKAILMGYACHNTTLTGEFYQVSGDYAGYAQSAFEEAHPGATALFMMLCGGDQNPEPRSKLELAVKHGNELAAAAGKAMEQGSEKLNGQIRSAFRTVDLPLKPHSRETFAAMANDSNVFRQRLAKHWLKEWENGRPRQHVLYPMQVVRLGDVTLVALGGEVVVDYNLRLKREYSGQKLIVAGYCNDVMCYIPSRRILEEGGYEAVDSMMYYGQPSTFSPDVEDTLMDALHGLLARTGIRPGAAK